MNFNLEFIDGAVLVAALSVFGFWWGEWFLALLINPIFQRA
jgi:hypothetical protein